MGQQLSTVDDRGDRYSSPPGMIRHFCGKSYIHPHGGSSNPSDNTKLIVHGGFHANMQFRFVQVQGHWGFIEHVPSGKFFHPQGGRRNPEKGTNLILHGGYHGGCLFTYNEDHNVIQHRGGLYIHPQGGSTNPDDNVSLVLDCDVHDGMRWFPVSADDIPAEVYSTPDVTGRWIPVKTTNSEKEDQTMTSRLKISVGKKKTMCNTFRHDWMISSVAAKRISGSIVKNNDTYGKVLERTMQSSFDDAFVVCHESGNDVIIWQWVWSVSQWGDGWDFKTNVITHTDNTSGTPSVNPLPVLLSL
ncbi:uncharacterized protein LOC121382621 isoform X2 [Gigantopelta aegis]|uniref:uncharacterized protein LOC121382621 isoform X2 n=1 Tax=Gigantopelta aegis TaxID=1735272 RepID=UPI001B88A000|nr:uncharacterized protein LOC121382621 isoform X2 [Gigantopelta aegis]